MLSKSKKNLIGIKEDDLLSGANDNLQLLSTPSGSITNVIPFDSGIMETGDTSRYTFRNSGSFKYYYTLHPNMIGKVTVYQ